MLEFNARFGDPETQVVLELIDNDLLDIMMKTSEAKLSDVDLKINDNKALCIVLSAGGYPESYDKNDEITISDMDSYVFQILWIFLFQSCWNTKQINLVTVNRVYQIFFDFCQILFAGAFDFVNCRSLAVDIFI